MQDEGYQNELFAYEIIDLLVQLGITYFCIAPGSRSTPLTLACANHPSAETFIHFDERGLGYHALGYAKATKKAAAVIVTSGTAVGNLMPAIMEAKESHTPMMILSADRPPELRACGANQTIDQVKIFTSFVKWHFDLPCPDETIPASFLKSLLSHAVFNLHQHPFGVAHLNCMFREPLHSKDPNLKYPIQKKIVRYAKNLKILPEEELDYLKNLMLKARNGLIVLGSLPCKQTAQDVLDFAKMIGWPVICDIQSKARESIYKDVSIPYFEAIIKTKTAIARPDFILYFGDRMVSKAINEWINQLTIHLLLITEHEERFDPNLNFSYRVCCNISWLCKLLPVDSNICSSPLLGIYRSISNDIAHLLSIYELPKHTLQEPWIFYLLSKFIPINWNLFIGNSNPIRDADGMFFPDAYEGRIFSNRGVSGIDGNISTAIGVACATKTPTVAVIGDLTFLHDVNSLYLLNDLATPVIVILINNGGGGIFSMLPISLKEKEFARYFATPHNHRLNNVSIGVWKAYQTKSSKGFLEIFFSVIESAHSCIIEVVVDQKENVDFRKQLVKYLSENICFQPSLAAASSCPL